MAENDIDYFIEKVRHEDNLTQLQRGQYTGTVTSQMCKDLASRIDATGLNVDLSKPVHISNCRGATPPLLNHCLHAIDAQV